MLRVYDAGIGHIITITTSQKILHGTVLKKSVFPFKLEIIDLDGDISL
jgi:hypothetical protein